MLISINSELLRMASPIPATVQVHVCGRWIASVSGSCPTKSMDIRLLDLLCGVRLTISARSLSLVHRVPTGCVIMKPQE
jgi:hypothetical protein